jgi:two-component system, NarL family, response regulator
MHFGPDEGRPHVGTIGVLLVDHHPECRVALRRLLEEDGVGLTGETDDPNQYFELAARRIPDVVIMHLPHPSADVPSVIQRIWNTTPAARVLAIVPRRPRRHARDAIGAGACGFVEEDASSSVLLQAVREVALGRYWIYGSRLPGFLIEESAS